MKFLHVSVNSLAKNKRYSFPGRLKASNKIAFNVVCDVGFWYFQEKLTHQISLLLRSPWEKYQLYDTTPKKVLTITTKSTRALFLVFRPAPKGTKTAHPRTGGATRRQAWQSRRTHRRCRRSGWGGAGSPTGPGTGPTCTRARPGSWPPTYVLNGRLRSLWF